MTKLPVYKKIVFSVFAFIFLFNLGFVADTSAGSNAALWGNEAGNVQKTSGLGNKDPRIIVAKIINIVLGFLGVIALVLILFSGFKWMTAAGNEEQVTSAKKTLISAVIGLIIILAAYSLASYVLDAIYRANT